jgi:UPF0755 protein
LYVKYRNVGKSLKAGVYTFTGSLTPELVLQKLVTGENQMMRLTIREGLKLSETIELLKESQLLDSSSAEQIITNMTPFDWQISHDTMEGILFPETYFYSKVTTVKQVIAMMTHGFKQTLPDQLADKLRAKGLKNLNELLTLASIVEKEAVISSERGTIASVYLNRLKKGMLLQSDPTVLYSLGKWKERVLYKDLEIDSPWNTYKYKGLPPTPICSPGKASILAVLNAPETEFLYFVATADGSGAHQFSKNLTGHNKNVQEFRKNRKKNNSK